MVVSSKYFKTNPKVFEESLYKDLLKVCGTFQEPKSKKVDALIKDSKGKTIFEKKNITFPESWSQLAINISAEKYMYKGKLTETGLEEESSIYKTVGRIVNSIVESGIKHGYFEEMPGARFGASLYVLMLHQVFSFNSPVWFNVGVHNNPRISACFILGIQDTMESILECAQVEGMIYKYGSGSGINYSALRGDGEALSHGGVSSGPMSFIQLGDAVAGSIKSGGTTRRAAKMVILNADHPDIEEFIDSKAEEENKARALIAAGYNSDFRDRKGAYATVNYQNANHSVRVTDEFMKAVEEDTEWSLVERTSSKTTKKIKARELFRRMAESAWKSGDPGLQFDNACNYWNSLPNIGRINGSNPCSEYINLDNTSCNLASINLMKFLKEDGFDYELFGTVSRVVTIALDILIEDASYPTEEITKNVRNQRQIGLGFANLGSLLMAQGLPYDSVVGRLQASAIASTMTANAYQASALMASKVGSFTAYENSSMAEILDKHKACVVANGNGHTEKMLDEWNKAESLMNSYGMRNSYVTNIAPTGTIGLQMDCDTTGIEPELALIKTKKLVGGGVEVMVNKTVEQALRKLGYDELQIGWIIVYLGKNNTLIGQEDFDEADLPVFATSFGQGKEGIAWEAHIKMLAAVQPFISGASSKTVNMPSNATIEDVELAYVMAWKEGLKCVAIYRDGCKQSQPLSVKTSLSTNVEKGQSIEKEQKTPEKPPRKKLADERQSITHKFSVAGHEGYITVGMFEDGNPGELFIVMSKEGSTISGLMDSFATAVSIALQYGVPLKDLIEKFTYSRYEPSGITTNENIRFASSLTDYIFKWLELKFIKNNKINTKIEHKEPISYTFQSDAPFCSDCGSLTVRNGSCFKCLNCGSTTGCS